MAYNQREIASLDAPGPFSLAYYQARTSKGCLFYALFQKDGVLKYTSEGDGGNQFYDDPTTSLVVSNETLFLTTPNRVLCATLEDEVSRPNLRCIIPEEDFSHIPQPLHDLRISHQNGVWVYAALAGFSHTGETHCAIILGAYRRDDEPHSPIVLYVDTPPLSLELSPMIRDSTLMFAYTCENQTVTIGVLSLKKQEGEWQTQDESMYYRTRTIDLCDVIQSTKDNGRDAVVHTLAFAKSCLVLFPMDICQGTSLSSCYACILDISLDYTIKPLTLPGNRVYGRLYGSRSGEHATFIGERDGLFEVITVEFLNGSDGTIQYAEIISKTAAENDTRAKPEPTIFYPGEDGLIIAAFPSRSGDKFIIRTYKRAARSRSHHDWKHQPMRIEHRTKPAYFETRPRQEHNDPKPRMEYEGSHRELQRQAPIMVNIPKTSTQQKPKYQEQ